MKKIIFSIAIIGFMVIASCTSTRIDSSWREPNKQIVINKLNKVLVVALLKNEASRRVAEDQMVAFLKGKGVVSYSYLDADFNKKNEREIREKIKEDGFDGAVTMSLVDVDKERNYTPGNISAFPEYYQTFSRYYSRNWSYYSNPGYYSTTKTYSVETNIYSIKEDKIIWSGLTKTTDPDRVDKMTKEIAKVVYKKMIKEGFINQ